MQHDHRPARALGSALRARLPLDLGDFFQNGVECRGHELVHGHGLVTFDQVRFVAVALEQRVQLALGDPRQHRRVGDLVAVQMQDGQHDAIGDRIQELVRVPRRRQRPGLGLAVADDARDQQIRVVEGSAEGMRE